MSYPEVIKVGIHALTNLDFNSIENIISKEIEDAGGLLTEEAATYLVADKLGFDINQNKIRGKDVWVYTFCMSRKNKEVR